MAIDFTAERKEQVNIQNREEVKGAKKEQKLKYKNLRPTWLTHNQTFCFDCEQLISTTTKCPLCGSSSPHGFLRLIPSTTTIFLLLTIGLFSADQYIIGTILLFIALSFSFADRQVNSERNCSKRSNWLGNDESHYVRKWSDKDISHLKILINPICGWIDKNLLTQKY